ncbi:hypothetical protein N8I77_009314 [Diaporthe amygdali]|uniref:Uncharacterized protein n=1 Tax=Phomopsis amygdali TaxID=1214568 RepID=A0AAD9W2C3_PHOAM|nr:hypothetical protein N8I77_009314 [Diaporthe amygdali]
MAPMTVSHNNTLPLAASNGTIILIHGVDSPWDMDLNTLITIVFGVIGIAFQAGHVYYRRTRRTGTIKVPYEHVENSGEHLAHRQGSLSGPWLPSCYWDEHQDYESAKTGLGRPASATPIRGVALRQAAHNDNGMQLGTRHLPEGHVYRRNPWRSNEWPNGTNPWPAPTGPVLQQQGTQRG